MSNHAKLKVAALALELALEKGLSPYGRVTFSDERRALRVALKAEPTQEVTGYVHPSTGRFVCDESQSSENKFTQDSAPGDVEKAKAWLKATGIGRTGSSEDWVRWSAELIREAHAAGRAEMASEAEGCFRRFEKRTEQRAVEDPEHALYHQGRSAAYADASGMLQALLAKLPEAEDAQPVGQ